MPTAQQPQWQAQPAALNLVFITDVAGVMVKDEPVGRLTIEKAAALIAAGDIRGGMVAKIESAIRHWKKVSIVFILVYGAVRTH